MNQEPTDTVLIGERPLRLSRPVLPHAARRLASVFPQLNALNIAGKSQADAAFALGVSVGKIRTWVELTDMHWTNLKRRGPYKTKA
jgi:hypothetical protein